MEFDFKTLVRLSLTSGYKLSGSGLAHFVNQQVQRHLGHTTLERFPIRFAAVAADVQTGELAAFNRGDCGRAVQASAAIPGRFDPVAIRGRMYQDGDLVAPMPVRWTRSSGARKVIAVDCSARVDNPPPGAEVYRQADLKKRALTDAEAKLADLTLHPDIGYWVHLSREYRERTSKIAYEYTMARRTDREWGKVLDRESGVEVLERTSDGALLALFAGNWRLARVQRDHPGAVLEPLVAASA